MKKILTVFSIVVCCLLMCNVGVSYGFDYDDYYDDYYEFDPVFNVEEKYFVLKNKYLYRSVFDVISGNVGIGGYSWWFDGGFNTLKSDKSGLKFTTNPLLINIGYNFNVFNNIDSVIVLSFEKLGLDADIYSSKDVSIVNNNVITLSLYNKYNIGNGFSLSGMISGSLWKYKYKEFEFGYYNDAGVYLPTYYGGDDQSTFDLALLLSVTHDYKLLNIVSIISKINTNYIMTNVTRKYGSTNMLDSLTLSPSIELGLMKDIFYNKIAPSVYVKYDVNLINRKEYFYLNDDKTNKTEKMKLHDDCFEYGAKLNIHLLDNVDFKVLYSKNSNKVSNFGGNFGIKF